MAPLLLTTVLFLGIAIVFPLGVIAAAIVWPWIVARLARPARPNHLHHGVAMAAGTAIGLFLRQNVFTFSDELLGGGVLWFIAITVGIIAYGLSTITLGIVTQMRREKSQAG
jgi:hypothetical protein